jgi:serine protease Do
MKLKLSLFLCLLVISGVIKAQSVRELYDKMLPSVVQVFVAEQSVSLTDPSQMVTTGGLGSGVLISENGHILTAHHVTQTASEIRVRFSDGEVFPAKVVSTSKAADVALLKLYYPTKDRIIAKIGDSDKVMIGDQVILIGNPHELEFSLSVGYISGRRRQEEFAHGSSYVEFFQTDAAINSGNSGGPMFNMEGEVVGIASSILTQSGGFEGIGFAATSNICKKMLIDERNPWMGVEGEYISGAIAQILNIPQAGGLLIENVVLLSPAGSSGLKGGMYPFPTQGGEILMLGGDIILAVNNISLAYPENFEKVSESLMNKNRGETFTLKVLRAGKIIELKGTF